MKKTLTALLMCCAATTTMAQQAPAPAVATIQAVEGLVTVTSGNQLTNAIRGMRLPQGAQVLSTATGIVTLEFASGCTITLQPSQTVLVEEAACTTFLASTGGPGAITVASAMTPAGLTSLLSMGVLFEVARRSSSGF
jgi:hypothetical protein